VVNCGGGFCFAPGTDGWAASIRHLQFTIHYLLVGRIMKISELAKLLGGTLRGEEGREVHEVAALGAAGPDDLTYAEGAKSLELATTSRAGCILVPEDSVLTGRTTIGVANPKLAFVRAAQVLCPPRILPPGVHATAVIAPGARIAEDAIICPYVVIESRVVVGQGTYLGAGVCLGEGAQIGSHCVLYPRVSVYPGARIGNRVILHSGVVIGSDGFGYVFAEDHYEKFPQRGGVVIEDDVEIGSNSTVDRGSLGVTVIGQGTKIDNLVQIAHNVKVGRHCVIAAQTGISGSAEIDNHVVMGGQVGVADHIRIEERAMIGGQAGIFRTIRRGTKVWGTPARPLDEFKKVYAQLANLPSLARKVKELSEQLSEGRKQKE
jgi:UDP-3-O-[3-hydroxymyristoyl] glucosamine N-acyltransferase